METITFKHGGEAFDSKYPDGIPTAMTITLSNGDVLESGLVMYPSGHARNVTCNLEDILHAKFKMHGQIALDDAEKVITECKSIASLSSDETKALLTTPLADRPLYKD